MNHRNAQEADVLLALFDKIFEDLILFGATKTVPKMDVLQCMQIMQVRNIGNIYLINESTDFD